MPRAKKTGKYKSKFEAEFAKRYPQLEYEKDKIKYLVEHTYNPDWKIKENTYIETKGRWTSTDRAKHLHVREQHPELTIYMVFMNPNNKLSRVSKTSYWEFCEKHNIPWATIDTIPRGWFN